MAKMLREQPELTSAVAEMTEPYGTISAVRSIMSGDAGPLDYMAAIPVIGGPARFAKGRKLAELLRKNDNLPAPSRQPDAYQLAKAEQDLATRSGDWKPLRAKEAPVDEAPPEGMEHLKFNDEFLDPATRPKAILRTMGEQFVEDMDELKLSDDYESVFKETMRIREQNPELYAEVIKQAPELEIK